MKRVLSVVFAIIILFLLGIKFAPSFIDLEIYKDQAVTEFKTLTGLDLNVGGDIEVSILPSPRFSVTDVSVGSPDGSKGEYLAQLKRFDVNVALSPLLEGKVSVSHVTLVDPVISLEMMKSGKLNAITKEVQSMISSSDGNSNKAAMPAIALEKVRIKNGSFSYFDHNNDNTITVHNINSDLSAKSLMGPYSAQGSMFYDGYSLNYDVTSDSYDVENKMLSPKIKLSLQPGDIVLDYEGVVSLDDGYSMQGQTSLKIDDINKSLSKYSSVNIVKLDLSLTSKGLLSLDAGKIDYKNFDIELGDQTGGGSLRVDFSPFKYSLSLKSDGDMSLDNIISYNSPFKNGSFDLQVSGNQSSVKLKNTVVKLDGDEFNVSGLYTPNNKGGRPKIDLRVKTSLLNYDDISSKLNKGASSKQSSGDVLSNLSLPVDLSLKVSAEKFIWQKNNGLGLDLAAKFTENSVSLTGFTINDIVNSSFKISGAVKNLAKTSGITAYIDVKSLNVQNTAKALGVDSSKWPKNLKTASVKAKLSGDTSMLDVTSNISAMGGEVIASGKVKNALETPAVDGLVLQIKHKNMLDALNIIAGARLNDKSLKGPLDIYSRIYQNGNHYELKDLKGDLSGISVQGSADLDLSGSVPKVKGDLHFGNVNLASVMTKSAGKSGSSKFKGQSGTSSRWSKSPIDTSALHAANVNLSLSANKIEYGAWPLIKPSLKIGLHNGELEIKDLKAGLFGGSLDFSASVKSVPKPRQPIHFESHMNVQGARLGLLSSALIGKKALKMSGNGNLNMKLKSSGASPAALIHDLAGNGMVSGRNITINGIDVDRFARALSEDSKAGDSVMGLWDSANRGGKSHFDTLNGDFSIKEGVVHLNKMDLDGATTAIETRGGVINLPKWTLATKHKIIVKGIDDQPSDVPPFEISFKGSLDNPAQTFGQGLLQDYLNRKIQRKLGDIISKSLGKSSNDNSSPVSEKEESSQPKKGGDIEDIAEEAIRGVLDGLLR
ncbi:MAG: AsmA family protein [Alphaproteobacteria bacterium]